MDFGLCFFSSLLSDFSEDDVGFGGRVMDCGDVGGLGIGAMDQVECGLEFAE